MLWVLIRSALLSSRNKKNIMWIPPLICSYVWQFSFMEIDHEVFSSVILFLPVSQEGLLSVSDERICTRTG